METTPPRNPLHAFGLKDLLWWCLARLKPHAGTCAIIMVGVLMQVALYVLYPLGFRVIFDRVLPAGDSDLLLRIMLSLGALFIVCGAGAVMQARLIGRVGGQVMGDLRREMFDKLNTLSSSFFARVESSDLIARFSFELATVELALVRALPALIECILVTLACLITIAVIDWRIAIVTLILLPLSFISTKWFGPRANALATERSGYESRLIGVLQESLNKRPIIRALGLEGETKRKFDTPNLELAKVSGNLGFVASLIPLSSLYGVNILIVGMAGTGAAFVITGGLSVGAFFGCFSLLMSVAAGTSTAAAWLSAFVAAIPKVVRIEELLAENAAVTDAPDAVSLPPMKEAIRFNDVVFGYTPDRPILKGTTCTIEAGSSVALVGGSGCGKSTMLNLITRFFDPDAGAVTFDSLDLRSVTQASLRPQMGMVMQEAHLFNMSIADNIRLGKLDATDEEVEAAARAAEIHDVIMDLPYGYGTYAGEHGGVLSGGQRQRIAIARAIVRAAPLLLLDEPTSALDPSTEASINDSIERLAVGRTVVMVTHRLAAVKRFSSIIVLQAGQVVEQGNHDALLARGGVYRDLWDKQSGFSISSEGVAHVTPERLRAIAIFASLELPLLEELASQFSTETFEADFMAIRQGDPGDKFYIIVRGSLKVVKRDSEGTNQKVAVLQDGDHFGEIALLHSTPRTASLIAEVPSQCLSLSREHFNQLVLAHPPLRTALEEAIARRAERSETQFPFPRASPE